MQPLKQVLYEHVIRNQMEIPNLFEGREYTESNWNEDMNQIILVLSQNESGRGVCSSTVDIVHLRSALWAEFSH